MVDYLCDMGAFSKSIFAHVYIGFDISGPPGGGSDKMAMRSLQ